MRTSRDSQSRFSRGSLHVTVKVRQHWWRVRRSQTHSFVCFIATRSCRAETPGNSWLVHSVGGPSQTKVEIVFTNSKVRQASLIIDKHCVSISFVELVHKGKWYS